MSWPADVSIVLVDFETTGLSAGYDRVVEIAYAVVDSGLVVERWQSLVRPNRPMGEDASKLNGITDAMLSEQPRFAEVGQQLCRVLNGKIMAAHNASFDLGFLASECAKAGWSLPDCRVADTLTLTRTAWRTAPDHKLPTLARRVGHRGAGAHRAMADVEALYSVLAALFAEFPHRFNTASKLLSTCEVIPKTVPLARHRASRRWRDLVERIADAKPIRMLYTSGSSGRLWRQITPKELFVDDGKEYLNAYCHRRDRVSTFRISKIEDVK